MYAQPNFYWVCFNATWLFYQISWECSAMIFPYSCILNNFHFWYTCLVIVYVKYIRKHKYVGDYAYKYTGILYDGCKLKLLL